MIFKRIKNSGTKISPIHPYLSPISAFEHLQEGIQGISKNNKGLTPNNKNIRAEGNKKNVQPDTSNSGEKQSSGLHYNVTLFWGRAKQEHTR
jgi:hypothetical protein